MYVQCTDDVYKIIYFILLYRNINNDNIVSIYIYCDPRVRTERWQ